MSTNVPVFDEDYLLNNQVLAVSNSHKDLGVIISANLDWSDHYNHICSQAYRTLGLLRRTFKNCTSANAKKLLYLSLVRSKLTYCSCVWRPHFIKDIVTLEKVQRRATKFVLNDYSSNYKSRLLKLEILPLMLVYEYYDIILFYKSLKFPSSGFEITRFVSFSSASTRSSSCSRLVHSKSSTNQHRHFYFNRLPRLWNSLPVFSLDQSLSCFKRQLKQILWNYFVSHFDPDRPCTFHHTCPCRNCTQLSTYSNFTQAAS